MSDDILDRLRDWDASDNSHSSAESMMEMAADEIERLRTIMHRIVDEDCTVAIQGGTFYADDEPLFAVPRTPLTQPTPGEGSKPREGTSEPVAWLVKGCEYDTGCEYEFVALLKEQSELAATQGGKAVPLYRSPALTSAEREAVARGAELADHAGEHSTTAAVLRALLERTQ